MLAVAVLGHWALLAARADEGSPAATPAPRPYNRLKQYRPAPPLPEGYRGEDWPCFLGPRHTPVSGERGLLRRWGPQPPPLVWAMEKGESYASPAVAGRFLVYPHRIGDETLVECLEATTGRRFWQFRYPTSYVDRYGYGNGPRATPVIDVDRVFVYSAQGVLYCLALRDGHLLWKKNLAEQYRVPQDFFGTATSPLSWKDRLIINVGAPKGPCVIALDKQSGKVLWEAGDQWGPSYATPVPAVVHGRPTVFVFAGGESRPPTGGLLSLNPTTGRIDFRFPWRSRSYESVNASSPLVVGNRVFVSATYETGSALLQVRPDFSHRVLWTTDRVGLHWNVPVHREGYLYAYDGRNEPDASLVCVELATGRVARREVLQWEDEVRFGDSVQKVTMSPFRGWLLQVDDGCLSLGEWGHLLWLDLTPRQFRIVRRAWLFAARETWTPPVLSRGLLYICQNTRDVLNKTPPRLLCYSLRPALAQPPSDDSQGDASDE